MKTEKIAGRVFRVYEEKEAYALGIKFLKNWRQAKKGDWILTKDGKVIQILNRTEKSRPDRKKAVVILLTGYGQRATTRAGIYAERQRGYRFDKELLHVKTTILDQQFFKLLLEYYKPGRKFRRTEIIECYFAVFEENNPNTAYIRGTAKIKKKWGAYMSREIGKIFEHEGMTKQEMAKEWMGLLDESKTGVNIGKDKFEKIYSSWKPSEKIAIRKEISLMIGFYDKDKDEDSGDNILMLHPDYAAFLDTLGVLRSLIDGKLGEVVDGKVIVDAKFIDLLNDTISDAITKGTESKKQITEGD